MALNFFHSNYLVTNFKLKIHDIGFFSINKK